MQQIPPPLRDPGLLTEWLPGHVALGLIHGGFRCYDRVGPAAVQAEAMRLKTAHENNASLAPPTWLGCVQGTSKGLLWRRQMMGLRRVDTSVR